MVHHSFCLIARVTSFTFVELAVTLTIKIAIGILSYYLCCLEWQVAALLLEIEEESIVHSLRHEVDELTGLRLSFLHLGKSSVELGLVLLHQIVFIQFLVQADLGYLTLTQMKCQKWLDTWWLGRSQVRLKRLRYQ